MAYIVLFIMILRINKKTEAMLDCAIKVLNENVSLFRPKISRSNFLSSLILGVKYGKILIYPPKIKIVNPSIRKLLSNKMKPAPRKYYTYYNLTPDIIKILDCHLSAVDLSERISFRLNTDDLKNKIFIFLANKFTEVQQKKVSSQDFLRILTYEVSAQICRDQFNKDILKIVVPEDNYKILVLGKYQCGSHVYCNLLKDDLLYSLGYLRRAKRQRANHSSG